MAGEEFPLCVEDSKWLINDLQRRCNISTVVPKISYALGGTVSSTSFSMRLIDDMSCVKNQEVDSSDTSEIGYLTFIELVANDAVAALNSTK
jgi:hypothetical protein